MTIIVPAYIALGEPEPVTPPQVIFNPDGTVDIGDAYGLDFVANIWDCDPFRIGDLATIREYVVSLLDVIGMQAYGEMLADRFALHDPVAAGYTATGSGAPRGDGWRVKQLITTSDVTVHFSESRLRAYLRLFSCRTYSPQVVADHTAAAFRGRVHSTTIEIRE